MLIILNLHIVRYYLILYQKIFLLFSLICYHYLFSLVKTFGASNTSYKTTITGATINNNNNINLKNLLNILKFTSYLSNLFLILPYPTVFQMFSFPSFDHAPNHVFIFTSTDLWISSLFILDDTLLISYSELLFLDCLSSTTFSEK